MERNHAFLMGFSWRLPPGAAAAGRLDPASCSSARVAAFHILLNLSSAECLTPSQLAEGHPLSLSPTPYKNFNGSTPNQDQKLYKCVQDVCVCRMSGSFNPSLPVTHRCQEDSTIHRSIDLNRHSLNTCSGQRILLVKIRNTRTRPKWLGSRGPRCILQEHVNSLGFECKPLCVLPRALFLGKSPALHQNFKTVLDPRKIDD